MITNKIRVDFKGHTFDVYVDGAGLDILAVDEANFSLAEYSKAADELFAILVDSYSIVGLAEAIKNSGAKVVA